MRRHQEARGIVQKQGVIYADGETYLYYVLMLELAEVLDLPYGGHVQAVFELSDLDLLDGDLPPGRYLPA